MKATTSAGGPRPEALAEPVRPVGRRWISTIMLANLGLFMALLASIQVLLPAQIERIDPAGKVTALGWVTVAGAVAGLVANPLAGALSDRTTSRFGRRHPWTLGGAVAAGAALALVAAQDSVHGVLLGWCLAQLAFNAMLAGLAAGVPDRVPVAQRAAVSGLIGVPTAVGMVVGVLLVAKVATDTAGYLLLGTLIILFALPYVLATPDPVLPRGERPPFGLRAFLAGFWISPRNHPDFAWAWITRFLVMLGNSMAGLYLLYFLTDAVHYEQVFPGRSAVDGLMILTLIYLAGAVVTAVCGGFLSDRLGRRRILVSVSSLVIAAGSLLLAFWPVWSTAMVAAGILGAGFGIYLAVDQALITQVLPSAGARAKDLGVINVANTGPQALAPALAAPVVTYLGGYTALYLIATLVVTLGGVLVWKIRSVP